MKTMQARQACKRIDEIAASKRKELKKAFAVNKLTEAEKLQLFVDREVDVSDDFIEAVRRYQIKIERRKSGDYWISPPNCNIFDICDYSEFEEQGQFKPGYEKALSDFNENVTNLKDEIWFGDEAEALAAIRSFKNKEVD